MLEMFSGHYTFNIFLRQVLWKLEIGASAVFSRGGKQLYAVRFRPEIFTLTKCLLAMNNNDIIVYN